MRRWCPHGQICLKAMEEQVFQDWPGVKRVFTISHVLVWKNSIESISYQKIQKESQNNPILHPPPPPKEKKTLFYFPTSNFIPHLSIPHRCGRNKADQLQCGITIEPLLIALFQYWGWEPSKGRMEGPGRLDEFWGGWIWWRLGYDIVAVVYYFWCYTEAWFLISLGDVFLFWDWIISKQLHWQTSISKLEIIIDHHPYSPSQFKKPNFIFFLYFLLFCDFLNPS